MFRTPPLSVYGADLGQTAVHAMTVAFEGVCRALNIASDAHARRLALAMQVIDLARSGERDSARLRDRVLRETQRTQFG